MRTLTLAALLVAAGCNRTEAQPARPARPTLPAEATVGADGRVTVLVDGEGYHPATIRAAAGRAITLVFRRTTDESCGQTLLVPSMNVRRELPLNAPVEVAMTVPTTGNIAFTCGMHMYQGSVVVQ